MTKRTRAAKAAPLSIEDPGRRVALASAGAAAVLAAIGMPALAANDPDAGLLALGAEWRASHARFVAAMCAMNDANAQAFAMAPDPDQVAQRQEADAQCGVAACAAEQDAASRADGALVVQIAAMPAKTLAGIVLKIEVSDDWSHEHENLVPSIMTDVLAYARQYDAATSTTERAQVERDPLLSALDNAASDAGGRDALLLALLPAWRLAEAEHRLCMDVLEIHEGRGDRTFPADVQRAAKMMDREALDIRTDAAVQATEAVAACIFVLPARTLDGILLKRKVLHNYGRGDRPAFEDSLSEDLLAMVEQQEGSAAA